MLVSFFAESIGIRVAFFFFGFMAKPEIINRSTRAGQRQESHNKMTDFSSLNGIDLVETTVDALSVIPLMHTTLRPGS